MAYELRWPQHQIFVVDVAKRFVVDGSGGTPSMSSVFIVCRIISAGRLRTHEYTTTVLRKQRKEYEGKKRQFASMPKTEQAIT
jgi:hypothetical protein